jgi:hypothetical protein
MSQKNKLDKNKKKIVKLYQLLENINNYITEKKTNENEKDKYEIMGKNILEIRHDIKTQKRVYQNLYQEKYFNELLNIIYNYYEEVRDVQTEIIYNDLLSLLETSVSS